VSYGVTGMKYNRNHFGASPTHVAAGKVSGFVSASTAPLTSPKSSVAWHGPAAGGMVE